MDERKEKSNESQQDEEEEDGEKAEKTILGIFTKEQFTMLCVAVGLIVLLLIITVTSVLLTTSSGSGKCLVMLGSLHLFGVGFLGSLRMFIFQTGFLMVSGLNFDWLSIYFTQYVAHCCQTTFA